MNRSDFLARVSRTDTTRLDLLLKKNKDYATEDFLSNFKRVHTVCKAWNIDPRRSAGDCARFLVVLKTDRWCNLIGKDTKPANESVEDTINDLHNYIDLASACDKESDGSS
jgi:hypothetical protein